jgi:hypothetical protein
MKKILLLCLLFAPTLAPNLAWAACERPNKPVFPDPRTADPALVEALDQTMQKYAAGMNEYTKCLTHEAEIANAEARDTISAYNQKFLPEYNKRATQPAASQ